MSKQTMRKMTLGSPISLTYDVAEGSTELFTRKRRTNKHPFDSLPWIHMMDATPDVHARAFTDISELVLPGDVDRRRQVRRSKRQSPYAPQLRPFRERNYRQMEFVDLMPAFKPSPPTPSPSPSP